MISQFEGGKGSSKLHQKSVKRIEPFYMFESHGHFDKKNGCINGRLYYGLKFCYVTSLNFWGNQLLMSEELKKVNSLIFPIIIPFWIFTIALFLCTDQKSYFSCYRVVFLIKLWRFVIVVLKMGKFLKRWMNCSFTFSYSPEWFMRGGGRGRA